jgi:hypothetical protein
MRLNRVIFDETLDHQLCISKQLSRFFTQFFIF